MYHLLYAYVLVFCIYNDKDDDNEYMMCTLTDPYTRQATCQSIFGTMEISVSFPHFFHPQAIIHAQPRAAVIFDTFPSHHLLTLFPIHP